jgi:hypothetical protein
MNIAFKSGQPITLTATRTFSMGGSNTQFRAGQEISFDGSLAIIDGESISLPQLRGAVKVGWLIPAESYVEGDESYTKPVSANIQVRHPTKGGNPMAPPDKAPIVTVETDERVVSNIRTAAQNTQDINRQHHANQVNGGKNRAPLSVDDQEGIPVRSLLTPAKSKTAVTPDSVGESLRKAAPAPSAPSKGMTVDEMLERMNPEDRANYLAEKEALSSMHAPPGARTNVGKVAASKKVERDGIMIGVTTGGGIETVDLSGSDGPSEVRTVEADGIKFTVTNGPKKDSVDPRKSFGSADPRRLVARAVCSEFPDNYDFIAPTKRRLGRLQADYSDQPSVIRAAFAAESDEMKALLVAEFPEAFSG